MTPIQPAHTLDIEEIQQVVNQLVEAVNRLEATTDKTTLDVNLQQIQETDDTVSMRRQLDVVIDHLKGM